MTTYADKPWHTSYPDWLPHDIEQEQPTMLDAFKASVQRSPDAVAIKYFDGTVTFDELDRHSDAFASGLLARGIEQGDRVALYLQNDPAFVVALVAAWKIGAIGVLINPMNRSRELTYLLKDSGARALVTLDELYDDVAKEVLATEDTAVDYVVVAYAADYQTRDDRRVVTPPRRIERDDADDFLDVIERHAGQVPPAVALSGSDLAALTYTSGTTGKPKGAMNTHGGIAFNVQVYRDWMKLTADDGILGVAPLFHITGLVGHIGLSLFTGAPLILNHRFEPEALMDAIREHRPVFTIGAITVFINLSHMANVSKSDWSSFRVIYSGGAPIAPAVNQQFLDRTGVYVHNIYGLTETTSPSHGVPLNAQSPVDPESGALSVGLPVFNTNSRILDENGAELPFGQVGEIAISGPQVVPGYWGKPDETAASLPKGELLTGDVGFMTEEGWFFVVDRKKDMINASGYKVWPREVEDVLYSHAAVREAAVVGVPDEYRGETVKAFVTLKDDVQVTEAELIDFCRSQMAAYKYPRSIEFLEELPKTTTGKIMRRELR